MAVFDQYQALSAGSHTEVPEEIAPGAMLFERFCALDPMVSTGEYWHVRATDLQRTLGNAPFHRVVLHFVPVPQSMVKAVVECAAVGAGTLQPLVRGFIDVDGGVVLVADESAEDAVSEIEMATARDLCELGSTMQLVGLGGFRTRPILKRDFSLLALRDSAPVSASALVDLFKNLGDESVAQAVDQPVTSLEELQTRLLSVANTSAQALSLPPRAPFVGREVLTKQLSRLISQSKMACASFIVFRGDRGVGKSRLLGQLKELAALQTCVVIGGSFRANGAQGRRGLANSLAELPRVAQELGGLDGAALATRVRGATAPHTASLYRLASELEAWLGGAPELAPIDINEDLVRHAGVIASALRAIGSPERPLVLVLDDLDYADEGAVEVVHQLFRDNHHHTVVLTAASGEIPQQVEGICNEREISPLAAGEIKPFIENALGVAVSDETALRIHRESGGNPLRAWMLLHSCLDRGELSQQDGVWHAHSLASGTVVDLFSERFAGMSVEAEGMVLRAAVSGGAFDGSWLGSVSELPEDVVRKGVERLLSSGVIWQDLRGALHFVHDLVRERVVQEASQDEVFRAHEDILAWLLGNQEADDVAVAYHQERSTRHETVDVELAQRHRSAGNTLLSTFQLDRAEWHFSRGLARCESGQAAFLVGLADIAGLRGESTLAAKYYTEAITAADSDDDRVLMAARGTYLLYCHGGSAQAEGVAEHALELVGHGVSPSKLGQIWASIRELIKLSLGRTPSGSREFRDGLCQLYTRFNATVLVQPTKLMLSVLRGARQAKNLATSGGATSTAFAALVWATLGKYKKAEKLFLRATEFAELSGNEWSLATVCHMRAHAAVLPAGNYVQGQALLQSAIDRFRGTGDLSLAPLSYMFRAFYGRDREPAEKVIAWCEEARLAALRHRTQLARFSAAAIALVVRARRGDAGVFDAACALEQELDSSRDQLMAADAAIAHGQLVRVFLQLGDKKAARAQLEKGMSLIDGPVFEAVLDLYGPGAQLFLEAQNSDEKRMFKRLRKDLAKAAKLSSRLRLEKGLVDGLAAANKNPERARKLLGATVTACATEGESYIEYQAHKALGALLAGDDVLAAVAHEERAQSLHRELRLVTRPSKTSFHALAPSPQPKPERIENERSLLLVLEELEGGLCSAVEPARFTLRPSEWNGSFVERDLAHLVLQVVFASRDSIPGTKDILLKTTVVDLDQQAAAALPGAKAGRYLEVSCFARGRFADGVVRPGLAACSEASLRFGGFAAFRSEDMGATISAYLPIAPEAAPAAQVQAPEHVPTRCLIAHSDEFLARNLSSTLQRMGVECTLVSEAPAKGSPWDLVFTQPSGLASDFDCDTVVQLVGTGDTPHLDHETLSFPFSIDLLDEIISRCQDASNEAEDPR